MLFIDLLKEINYFKSLCRFDEFREKYDHGHGIGYGSAVSSVSKQVEAREKTQSYIFKNCIDLFDEFGPFIIQNNIIDYIQQLLMNSSFIFVHNNLNFFTYWKRFKNEDYDSIYLKKVNIESMMNTLRESKNIILDEDLLENHFYKNEVMKISERSKNYKRILIEMMDLNALSCEMDGFYIVWSNTHYNIMRFMISSENEPYLGGLYEFDVFFPPTYPDVPPLVHFMTTGSNAIRFNPNLYSDGKVCLSLLGTWAGEQWNPRINTFLHVVHAINAMILTENPVQNEPAYSLDKYYDHPSKPLTKELLMVRKYKLQIKYFVLKFAILDHFKHDSSLLKKKSHEYFLSQKDKIIDSFTKYADISDDLLQEIIAARSFQSNGDVIFTDYKSLLTALLDEFRKCLNLWNQ
jgi:baculoviral IAP repeat-containing protein 6